MNIPGNTFLLLLAITAVLVMVEGSIGQRGPSTATEAMSGLHHRKFTEYGEVCSEDEKAHLDNFAIELQRNAELRAYIIFYGGRCWSPCSETGPRRRPRYPRKGEAETRAARMKPYLVDIRGLDPDRIVVIDGGYRESWTAELWLSPKDVGPPAATPTVRSQDIKYRKGKPGKREFCRVSRVNVVSHVPFLISLPQLIEIP